MGKNLNSCRRSLSLFVFLFTVFACCGLAGDAEAGGGGGLQTSDTFGVGERISTIPKESAIFSCSVVDNASVEFANGVVTITIGAG